jgi:hypothetical protein
MEDKNYRPMFTGREKGKPLTPDEARQRVQKFNCNRKPTDIKAHYFSRAVLEKLLADKDNIKGIRVYYGMTERADIDAVIVGVDAHGENIFKGEFTERGGKDVGSGVGGIYASADPCPTHCPTKSTNFA